MPGGGCVSILRSSETSLNITCCCSLLGALALFALLCIFVSVDVVLATVDDAYSAVIVNFKPKKNLS